MDSRRRIEKRVWGIFQKKVEKKEWKSGWKAEKSNEKWRELWFWLGEIHFTVLAQTEESDEQQKGWFLTGNGRRKYLNVKVPNFLPQLSGFMFIS